VCSGRQTVLTALAVLFAVLSGTPAVADPRAQFTPEVAVHGQTLPLRGTGRLVWMRMVTVYDAGLYLPAGVPGKDALKDVAKRLELRYHISIKREKFGESAVPFLEKNVAAEELARLKPRLEQLNRLYRDVKEGDRYALTYVPGTGTTLTLNGNPLGTVDGADFAAAYFTIWLGAKPISDTMRDELMGTATRK
jgi:hypothetical protein